MRQARRTGVVLFLLGLAWVASTAYGAEKRRSIIGREILNFVLPSTEDRVINYADEYYGKRNLIITFFPAAFTPV